MLRDLKFLRRTSGKNSNLEEVENVPVNPRDSLGPRNATDSSSSRAPFSTIQEPFHNLKGGTDHDVAFKAGKIDRTPTKPKSTPTMPLRTPERQPKYRFGWAQKGDSCSNAIEAKDEGRSDVRDMVNTNTPRSTRTDGRRANSGYSECHSTQSTPTKSVSKPPYSAQYLTSGSTRPPASAGARVSNFAALSKGIPISSNSCTVVNTIEVPHFELKEDPSFWLEHSVQVLIRVRPLNNAEKSTYGYSRCLKQESAQCISWIGQPETRFTFDHVACETIDQETLFRMVGLPMVENCLSGYNSCMFAYGQTGSGKTHTMLGDIEELEIKPSSNRGMTPRIFEFLFARIRAEEDSRKDENLQYHCKCSFLEIYNEQITDLLDPSSTNLMLREDMKKGVYVENLSEFDVQTVADVLKLVRLGSSNRKVAATNMNRESSRSHSVFTCVIESVWEKDSASSFRFARLNLVDLAGSERQKTSGAEGDRLKEAASINKSLSTLGHVIMVLVDVANGRPRHVPYRDSRLTFLLQDSLGGNSKTMIIANVSPSVCSAAETLNTLKFAQRAKLIQNNAIVNEDSSGDVIALKSQIQLLKEELSLLKRQNVSRALSFGQATISGTEHQDEHSCPVEAVESEDCAYTQGKHCEGTLRLSTRQMRSLETTLTGAFRREKMTETSIKQLEAEIEQLNRLVHQREEDTRCTKMMLKFREDKIQRMESLVGGLISSDAYLVEENNALTTEVQLLQAKIEKNPEVTRFALENIRLLEQLRRFQDFYEEGEREMLLAEVSELRDQLLRFLDGNLKPLNHPEVKSSPEEVTNVTKENDSLKLELKRSLDELEECRSKLSSCIEYNAKLEREIEELQAYLGGTCSLTSDHASTAEVTAEVIKEPISEAPYLNNQAVAAESRYVNNQTIAAAMVERQDSGNTNIKKHSEEILHLQLEMDILKIILSEERSCLFEVEKSAKSVSIKLDLSNEKVLSLTEQCEAVQKELDEAKSVIDALESQQILAINELEDLKSSNNRFAELLHQQELELSSFRKETCLQESRKLQPKDTERVDSPLQVKLNKMHKSLEKAKRLNQRYQNDQVFQDSNEEEMDEVRRQVEAETAEVIVCLQEELANLQQEVLASNSKEIETSKRLELSLAEVKIMEEKLCTVNQENMKLSVMLQNKEQEVKMISEEWEMLTSEVEAVLIDGHESLADASDQLDIISKDFLPKRSWISEQVGRMRKCMLEKDLLIEELNQCLEDAFEKKNEMECMLRSLKGAAVVMTEAHQEECKEKDNKIILLNSQLAAEAFVVLNLKNRIKNRENQLKEVTTCAMASFVVLSRFSESNAEYLGKLEALEAKLAEDEEQNMKRNIIMQHQVSVADEAEEQIQSLKREIEALRMQLSEEQMNAGALRQQIEEHEEADILRTGEKLTELKSGVFEVKSCIKNYSEGIGSPVADHSNESSACLPTNEVADTRTGSKRRETSSCMKSPECPSDLEEKSGEHREDQNDSNCPRTSKGAHRREATIILLKKEIESALESLKGVQAEMTKLHSEKEIVSRSEKESKKSIGSLASQTVALQNSMDHFEGELKRKMEALDGKLKGFEQFAHCSCTFWFQKELIEAELADAKVAAVQKATEAACILAKFEEVQDTLKEADIMINQLVIANEALKLDIKKMKENELLSVNSSNILIEKVKSLESINDLKDRNHEELEKQVKSDIMMMEYFVEEMGTMISQVKDTSMEECMSLASDCKAIKSQVDGAMKLIKSSLEDIWSEIIMKDSAVSVLHLCHIGVLLETVTGLNAENSFLHHGVDKSNAIISELREHNFRSKRDLERCRILEGKLLADIKNNFDRISKQEDETGEFCVKLNTFHQKILDLQLQEEQMLQRSNSMGSELTALMTELDLSNKNVLASLLDQERLLREKEELFKTQEENFIMGLSARDLELFIMSCKLNELVPIKANLENTYEVVENFKRDIILWSIDARLKESLLVGDQVEFSLLQNHLEEAELEKMALLIELDIRNIFITEMDELHKTLLVDLQASKETDMNDLKTNLCELTKAKQDLSSQVEKLHAEYVKSSEEKKATEAALELSSSQMSAFEQQNRSLQANITVLQNAISQLENEQELKDLEFSKLSCLEEENAAMLHEIGKVKTEHCLLSQDLDDKKTELESSLRRIEDLVMENQSLQANIGALKEHNINLQSDLDITKTELDEVKLSECMIKDHLELKGQDLKIQVDKVKSLQEENASLRNELTQNLQEKGACLNALSLNVMKCVNSVEHMQSVGSKVWNLRSGESKLADTLFSEIHIEFERIEQFMDDIEHIGKLSKELESDTATLQTELVRKDQLLNGLLFDMRLLQESASTSKDQKDEKESLVTSMRALEEELKLKSASFAEAVKKSQKLETELQERMHMVSALEFDIAKEQETVKSLSCKIVELMESKRKVEEAKEAIEEELTERRLMNESLEKEITEMGITLDEMSCTVEMLKSNLNNVTSERDDLLGKLHTLKKELEIERAMTEENGMLLAEAREEAEATKLEVEHKEEEVKLLERSIEELECTVNVLENKVDILKGEAERQRLQREELETELEAVKEQMHGVKICDDDMKRKLMDKEKTLRENLQRVEILERELAERDEEIARCKSHISEVTLHADAQASEYKQKFKALEAMVEQLKQDIPAVTHGSNSSANKLEKNTSKSRGSGSPFKCIGLGLVQQIKSEKEEERHRVEELEALANNRQKEIFMLNARLATAESMTHDVIRDLLGLKLDMNNCATMLDTRELQTLTEKAQDKAVEARFKEEELDMLKQQLNAFVMERKGWLEEIDRKQAELVAAQVALEKLRQREHLLQAENQMFKVENVNQKKRVMELEAEVRKLSGQQNIQQRIHHHAKIKEENNLLKNQNDELGVKLKRTEAYLTRVKEELAKYRMASGTSPCINLDEEERLSNKLKETEAERLQLAQKLVSLCTSILKAAGITRAGNEVNPAAAEEAIEHLKRRINTLETELQDVKLKNRMNKERIRLTELMPLENETPPNSLALRRTISSRPQTPYLSALDR